MNEETIERMGNEIGNHLPPMEVILDILDYFPPEAKWILSRVDYFSWINERYDLENLFRDNHEFISIHAASVGSILLLKWGFSQGNVWFYSTVNEAKKNVNIEFLFELGRNGDKCYREDGIYYLEDTLSYLDYYLGLFPKEELIEILND